MKLARWPAEIPNEEISMGISYPGLKTARRTSSELGATLLAMLVGSTSGIAHCGVEYQFRRPLMREASFPIPVIMS